MSYLAQPIYPLSGIRAIEAKIAPTATPTLMERAGRAAAEEAVRMTLDRPGPVLIACGPGNNGGDGFVMARRLLEARRPVTVAFAGDAERMPSDGRAAYEAWLHAGGEIVTELPAPPQSGWSLAVDALFGIGISRAPEGRYADWIAALNALPCPRLAVDIPSGLDADTGRVFGSAFRATRTLTFVALKPGLLTLDGPDVAGEVVLNRLEVDAPAALSPPGHLVHPSLFAEHLGPRRRNTHKGSYGEVGLIGGAPGMAGAALLGGRAALLIGAGRVYVGMVDPGQFPVDPCQPELMLRDPEAVMEVASVLAVGPGLGMSAQAARLLRRSVATDKPLVLDADALNLLALDPSLQVDLAGRSAPTLITPHPAEAGRLLGTDSQGVQQDRIATVQALACRFNAHVVLKGCGSIIGQPDGHWMVNTSGHPGMACAGMGDVLTGLLIGLLAQRWPAQLALPAAVHLHGAAADQLSLDGVGPIGLTASELIPSARKVFNHWIQEAARHAG